MSQFPRREFVTGRLITAGSQIEHGVLAFEGNRIAYAGAADGFAPANGNDDGGWVRSPEVPDGSVILPGLVDIHCHGGHGGDFPSGNAAQARTAVDFLHRSGTTTLLASLVTAAPADLLQAIGTLSQLVDAGVIAGIHLEGPFLSSARCGAQDPAWLLEPDLALEVGS